MGERQIGGFAGVDRERNADDACGKGVEAGGFGVERGQFGGFDFCQPGVELLPGQDGFVAGGDRSGRWRGWRCGVTCSGIAGRGVQISQPGAEFVAGEQLAQGFGIAIGRGQRTGRGQFARSQATVTSFLPSGRKSRWSRRFSPTTPPISAAWATTPSSEPYCSSHLTAVLGPTLGTPGTLSTVSPTSVR